MRALAFTPDGKQLVAVEDPEDNLSRGLNWKSAYLKGRDVRVLDVDRDGAFARVRLGLVDGQVVVVHLERAELPAMRLTCSSMTEEPPATWGVRSIVST